MKKSFLLYCDLIHTIEQLTNEQAGDLFKHILRYVNDQEPATDNVITRIAFEPIKQSLKRDYEKYENIRQRNSDNARKRWDATASSGIRNDTKNADSDSDSDNDSVSDNEREIVKVKSAKALDYTKFTNQDLIDALKPYIDKFGKDTCNDFYSYWSEPLPNGKMRMTKEKAWYTARRLAAWKLREKNPNQTFVKQAPVVFNRSSQGKHYVGDDVI